MEILGLGEDGVSCLRHGGGCGTGISVPGMFAASRFYSQIETEEDIEKIKDPVIEVDYRRTEEFFQVCQRVFEGIIPVRKRGAHGFCFAPWDGIVA